MTVRVADCVDSRALRAGPADRASPWVLNTLHGGAALLCPFLGGERQAQRGYITCPETRLQRKHWVHTQELELLGVNLHYLSRCE